MKNKQHSIILKTYELLKLTIPTINRVPRIQKFTFGDRLQHLLSDLLEQMIEVYYAPKMEKPARLTKINIQIEKIRFFYRLGHELGFYSAGHLGVLAEKLNEIGKRVGAWK